MATASDMPLSIAHLSELEVAPLDLVELAARAGFSSIGLRTNPASPGGIVYPLATSAEQAEMRRRLAANGTIGSVHRAGRPVGANARVRLPADAGTGRCDRGVASRRRRR
jgi:hypothetical protein